MLMTAHCVYCEGSCKARCSRMMCVRCWPRRWLQAWLLCGRGVMRLRCQHRAPALLCALQEEEVLPPQPRVLLISSNLKLLLLDIRIKADYSTCSSTSPCTDSPL